MPPSLGIVMWLNCTEARGAGKEQTHLAYMCHFLNVTKNTVRSRKIPQQNCSQSVWISGLRQFLFRKCATLALESFLLERHQRIHSCHHFLCPLGNAVLPWGGTETDTHTNTHRWHTIAKMNWCEHFLETQPHSLTHQTNTVAQIQSFRSPGEHGGNTNT